MEKGLELPPGLDLGRESRRIIWECVLWHRSGAGMLLDTSMDGGAGGDGRSTGMGGRHAGISRCPGGVFFPLFSMLVSHFPSPPGGSMGKTSPGHPGWSWAGGNLLEAVGDSPWSSAAPKGLRTKFPLSRRCPEILCSNQAVLGRRETPPPGFNPRIQAPEGDFCLPHLVNPSGSNSRRYPATFPNP